MTAQIAMTDGKKADGNGLNLALWICQYLLAAAYAFFGVMKATESLTQLAVLMKWVPKFSPLFVRGLGIIEVLGAIGILAPALTRIKPGLTVVAAACFVLLQVCAISLHVSRGEFNVLGLNVVLIGLAIFVLWGRGLKARIAPRT